MIAETAFNLADVDLKTARCHCGHILRLHQLYASKVICLRAKCTAKTGDIEPIDLDPGNQTEKMRASVCWSVRITDNTKTEP